MDCRHGLPFTAWPIVDALVTRAQNGVYGYTDCPLELERAFLSRLKIVYGCTADMSAAWFRWLPGLIPGCIHAVRATCSTPQDAVAIPANLRAFLGCADNERCTPSHSSSRGACARRG